MHKHLKKNEIIDDLCARLWIFSQLPFPRRRELHADRQPGAEEAGVSLPHELRQEPARHGHHGRQHIRQGNVPVNEKSAKLIR